MVKNNNADIFIERFPTTFLRVAILMVGLFVLVICIFALPEAYLEGTRFYAEAMFLLYLFMIGLYAASIPTFIAFYQAFKLLGYIDRSIFFSEASIIALKYIKYCAVTVGVFFASAVPFFFYIGERDDAPGAMLFGLLFFLTPIAVAVFTELVQRLTQDAIDRNLKGI